MLTPKHMESAPYAQSGALSGPGAELATRQLSTLFTAATIPQPESSMLEFRHWPTAVPAAVQAASVSARSQYLQPACDQRRSRGAT